MRPNLKPNKGWKYRIILCNEKGKYVYDDVISTCTVIEMTKVLLENLSLQEAIEKSEKT